MVRTPRCSKDGFNKGAWTAAEDKLLTDHIKIHGEGKWSNVAKETGLKRCGKSCRLRWMNYLRPDIKRGNISQDEEELIIRLHKLLGNRWSLIAGRLPGRTDNEIKNYWNTNMAKKASELSVQLSHQIKPKLKPLNDRPAAAASNIVKAAKMLPGNNVLAAPEDYKHQQQQQEGQDHNIYNVQLPAAYVDGNWPNNYVNYETKSSDASPPSASGEVHTSDFMNMDFDIEDICKMLDSDFTKFNYDIIDSDHLVEADGVLNVPDNEPLPSFPVKMEELEKSSGSEGVEADMASEFLWSLASSFLESAEQEWPGDELNLIHAD